MNCREGDLAIIVKSRSQPGTIGKIVRCVRFKPSVDGMPAWLIERSVCEEKFFEGLMRPGNWFLDECLRPLRDNDEQDQTLTYAGKPTPLERVT